MIWLVCYDITHPRRLRRTAKYLEKCGIRVQYSFFQVEMTHGQFERMKKGLLSIIDKKKDKLGFYPICSDCSQKHEIIGKGTMLSFEPYEIL